MITRARVVGIASLLVGAGAVFVCVAFAFGREREYTLEGTLSPRIGGRWKIAFLGKNPHGVECERDLSSLAIQFDEWFATHDVVTDARWDGRPYELWARGRLSVGGSACSIYLAVPADGDARRGFGPFILLDVPQARGPVLSDDHGPLFGCGWGDRLSLILRVPPGTALDTSGSESDRLLVGFGSDERGAVRPHEYARASTSD